ncbi:MAG: hypothetical protein IPO03_01605 [Bacteroidetes bacterium]|nr:hypothetical protein [Bacteroidota bacterium]
MSLDTDKQKWLDALAADNVSWPCQTIDTKSWNAKSAIDFEVNFLPKIPPDKWTWPNRK